MRPFLLWDHDGVLVDTERWFFVATQECLRELGVASVSARISPACIYGVICSAVRSHSGDGARRHTADGPTSPQGVCGRGLVQTLSLPPHLRGFHPFSFLGRISS